MYPIEMFPTKDTFITSIRIGPVSGDPIPRDYIISSDPGGCMIVVRTRLVMRLKQLVTPTITLSDVIPYCGTVKPAKEDIFFVSSLSFGIQAVYKHAEAVGEPVILEHELPTATYVSFIHLLVPVPPPTPPTPVSRSRHEDFYLGLLSRHNLNREAKEEEAKRQPVLVEAQPVATSLLTGPFMWTVLIAACFAVRYYMLTC